MGNAGIMGQVRTRDVILLCVHFLPHFKRDLRQETQLENGQKKIDLGILKYKRRSESISRGSKGSKQEEAL